MTGSLGAFDALSNQAMYLKIPNHIKFKEINMLNISISVRLFWGIIFQVITSVPDYTLLNIIFFHISCHFIFQAIPYQIRQILGQNVTGDEIKVLL